MKMNIPNIKPDHYKAKVDPTQRFCTPSGFGTSPILNGKNGGGEILRLLRFKNNFPDNRIAEGRKMAICQN
jgi:hypothetical protein